MHYITIILVSILILLKLFTTNIEGLVLYNWNHPGFTNEPKLNTLDIQVETSSNYPQAYSSVPIDDQPPIKLESIEDLFDKTQESSKYSTILDKLNIINEKLDKSSKGYMCTNTNAEEEPFKKNVFKCDSNKLLSYNANIYCDSIGCTEQECCVDLPTNGNRKWAFIHNKCFPVSTEKSIDNTSIFSTKSDCETYNKSCSSVPQDQHACTNGETFSQSEELFCVNTQGADGVEDTCNSICCN